MTTPSVVKDVERMKFPYTAVESVNQHNLHKKAFTYSFKVKHIFILWASNSTLKNAPYKKSSTVYQKACT